jgi:hypothetical protein
MERNREGGIIEANKDDNNRINYVYMYIYIYVFIYAYIYTYMYAHKFRFVYISKQMNECILTQMYMYLYIKIALHLLFETFNFEKQCQSRKHIQSVPHALFLSHLLYQDYQPASSSLLV